MQKFSKLFSLMFVATLAVSVYAPQAQARLLFSNETDYTKGDSFIIDFDDNADGDITLQFGQNNPGGLMWNVADQVLTSSGDFEVLGAILNPTLSGLVTFDENVTVVGLESEYVNYAPGVGVTLPSGLTSGDVDTVNKALDELWKEIESFTGGVDITDIENLLAYHSGLLENLENNVSYHSGLIQLLSGAVDQNQTDISNNTTNITDNSNVINYHSGLIQNLSGAVDQTQIDITNLSGAVDQNQIDIDNNTTNITNNTTAINENGDVINYHSGLIEDINFDIAYLSGVVEDNRDDITILQSDLVNLETDIVEGSLDIFINDTYTNFTSSGNTLADMLTDIDNAITTAATTGGTGSIGLRDDVIVRNALFEGAIFEEYNAGSNKSRGTMEADSDANGNYYDWSSRRVNEQSVDIVTVITLPEDFVSFAATNPLEVTYATTNPDGTITESYIDVTATNLTDAQAITLGGATNLSGTYTTDNISMSAGSGTVEAGEDLELRFKMNARRDTVTGTRTYASLYGVKINYVSDLQLAEQP